MTIGKIYFALVDPEEVFDEEVHNREDEQVLRLTVSQREGDFALAEVEIENPSEGLLKSSRKRHVFISVEHDEEIKLLFSGRIVGFPSDLSLETVVVNYIAQPENWKEIQDNFLDNLKVHPFYNELFIGEDRRNNLSEVLAARSQLLHWDRSSHSLSLSDIIEGQSLVDLGPEVIFDTVRVEIGDPPVNGVDVAVEVQWEQFGVGEVDVGSAIRNEFTNSAIATAEINTLTPLSFEDAWRGARVPLGYEIIESKLSPTANLFGLQQAHLRSGLATVSGEDFPTRTGAEPPSREVSVPRLWYRGTLNLQAVYEQKRRENMVLNLSADIQELSLAGEQTEEIFVRLQDPTANAQGSVFDAKLPSFFYDVENEELSNLGREAVEYSIMLARARLVKANRAVETRFECDLSHVIDVKLDHSIRFEDDRLPGGSIRGKVVDYLFSWDGDSGQQVAKIGLASSIGKGASSQPLDIEGEEEVGLTVYENEGIVNFWQIEDALFLNNEGPIPDEELSDPRAIFFRPDGLKVFLVGRLGTGPETARLIQMGLNEPFTLSTLNFEESIFAGSQECQGVFFRDDGLIVYTVGGAGQNRFVAQRNLANPWDISDIASSSFFSLSTTSVSAQSPVGFPRGIYFHPSGEKFFLVGSKNNIAEFDLTTAWDITTAEFNDVEYFFTEFSGPNDIHFSPDGRNLYVIGSDGGSLQSAWHYELATPWDITDLTFIGVWRFGEERNQFTVPGISSTPEGDQFFLTDRNASTIFGIELTAGMNSSVFYVMEEDPVIEIPVDVPEMETDDQYLIDGVTVENDGQSQNTGFVATSRPDLFLEDNPTSVVVDLKTMNPEGELTALIEVSTSKLPLPRQVDLEA